MTLPAKIAVVTGAAGYLGTEITKQLLEKGYTVRATARKASSKTTGHLEALAKALPGALELFEVELQGSYHRIAEEATYIFHVASPAEFGSGNPEEDQRSIVDPAVIGTQNVMSAAANAKTVKRVILTSSIVAMVQPGSTSQGTRISECDWNTHATLQTGAYPYSKVLAEKAAWAAAQEAQLDLVVINPSHICGPAIGTRGGYSVGSMTALLEGQGFEALMFPLFIDVRDTALAHVRAAETPSAKGRYILSHSAPCTRQELQQALQAELPKIAFSPSTPAYDWQPLADADRARKDLGIALTPIITSFIDQARSQLALGLGQPKLKA